MVEEDDEDDEGIRFHVMLDSPLLPASKPRARIDLRGGRTPTTSRWLSLTMVAVEPHGPRAVGIYPVDWARDAALGAGSLLEGEIELSVPSDSGSLSVVAEAVTDEGRLVAKLDNHTLNAFGVAKPNLPPGTLTHSSTHENWLRRLFPADRVFTIVSLFIGLIALLLHWLVDSSSDPLGAGHFKWHFSATLPYTPMLVGVSAGILAIVALARGEGKRAALLALGLAVLGAFLPAAIIVAVVLLITAAFASY